MEENNKFECCRLKINIVTPVHIADGSTIGAKEYLYDPQKSKVYFLNEAKWHSFIAQNNLFASYEKYLQNRFDKRSLLEWLQNEGFGINDVISIIKASADTEVNILKNTINTISFHIKQANGKIYIPGSSIKGAFRTALIFRVLNENPEIKQKYWNKLQEINENFHKNRADKIFRKSIKEEIEQLEVDLLHKLEILKDGAKDKKSIKSNAVYSIMKGLSISDAYAESEINTALLQKRDFSLDTPGNNMGKPLPLFRECSLPGEEFYCMLKIDKAALMQANIKSIDDILMALKEFYDFIYFKWSRCFGKYEYVSSVIEDASQGNLFLGAGSGFLTKTLLAALAPDEKEAVQLIKEILDVQFKKHKHLTMDRIISPRTLKLTSWRGKTYLQGIARVEKI